MVEPLRNLSKINSNVDIGNDGLGSKSCQTEKHTPRKKLKVNLSHHDDQILYNVAVALKMGISVEKIYKLSTIDPWFIEKIKNIVDIESKNKRL